MIQRLKEIAPSVCKGTANNEEIAYVKSCYQKAFGVPFSQCKCMICDAIFMIIKKLNTMSNYKLKKGICLRVKFGDPVFITSSNLTDKLAEEYLKNNPGGERFFDFVPEKHKVQPVQNVILEEPKFEEPEQTQEPAQEIKQEKKYTASKGRKKRR
jgi:hypothetical protein